MDDLISRAAAIDCVTTGAKPTTIRGRIAALPPAESERMKLVQEAVHTIMKHCKENSVKDKAFRNAARFIQNAIDGRVPDFEAIRETPVAEPERE